MSSFRGGHTYSVDNKGRINIPAKLRKNLSLDANDTFIIIRGFEKCLFVYPLDEWNRVEQRLRELSTFNPDHRFLLRTIFEHVAESTLDGQSRIAIPSELRSFAEIDGDVLIIGALDRIEIWNPRVFQAYKKSRPETYEEIAAKVMGTP